MIRDDELASWLRVFLNDAAHDLPLLFGRHDVELCFEVTTLHAKPGDTFSESSQTWLVGEQPRVVAPNPNGLAMNEAVAFTWLVERATIFAGTMRTAGRDDLRLTFRAKFVTWAKWLGTPHAELTFTITTERP